MAKKAIDLYRAHFFADWQLWIRKPRCSLEDQAILMKAIDEYWLAECKGLPADIVALAELLGVEEAQASSMLRNTLAHTIEDGRLHFTKVHTNFVKAQELSAKQSARAKARFSKSSPALPRHSHPTPTPTPNPDPDPDPDPDLNFAICLKEPDKNA